MSIAHAPGQLFCFGMGYSARTLAGRLMALGWAVGGTSRSDAGVGALRAKGIAAVRFERGNPFTKVAALAEATHVLLGVPPDEQGDPVFDALGAELGHWMPGLVWVGYLSTTGVYGDTGGAWVSESSPLRPSGARQRRRVEAEAAWLRLYAEQRLPVHIFRLAGIYGPGRSALDQVRAGVARRIDKPGHVFSRIHVDDIAGVLLASMARPNPGAIYNVCDDHPTEPAEVIAYACQRLGQPTPPLVPFATAELSPMAAGFWSDNRRVTNSRIKQELGVRLIHPDYRSGLDSLLLQENDTL